MCAALKAKKKNDCKHAAMEQKQPEKETKQQWLKLTMDTNFLLAYSKTEEYVLY